MQVIFYPLIFDFASRGGYPVQQTRSIKTSPDSVNERPADTSKTGHKPKLLDRLREALSALLFLYRHVIGREVGDLSNIIRARKPTRLPVVMTRDEVKAVLSNLSDDKRLMASLMYGAGLRPMECLRLRVQDIDFARNEIPVRDGKGSKDRITVLPESLKAPLQACLKKGKASHEKDLAEGWGHVQMPGALDRAPHAQIGGPTRFQEVS